MKLNRNRKCRLESLDWGYCSSPPPALFLSLCLFSCFLFFTKQAAAFYSFNDYSVFLERDASHLQTDRLTWPWINSERRRQPAIPRLLNGSSLYIQQRNIYHHKLVCVCVCVCVRRIDAKIECVYVTAVMMIKLKGIWGKINGAWWFGGCRHRALGSFTKAWRWQNWLTNCSINNTM